MDLSYAQVGYFITQVALSAASFGVAQDDLKIVGAALGATFDFKCSPPTTVIPAQGPQLQSICTGDGCPLDANATCALYQTNITMPSAASMSATPTKSMGASSTASATGTSSSKPAQVNGAAAALPAGVAVLGAIFAYLL